MAEENLNNLASENTEVKAAPEGEKPSNSGRNNRRPQNGHRPNNHGNNGRRRPEEKEYEERIVKISRVSKTVKGGKIGRFTTLIVIGDGKGKYGYGLGKSKEVPDAIKKSLAAAKRNMFKITIAQGDTITHPVMGKFGATQVFLKPAPAGTGLVAGGAVRAILELAGIKNVYSKIYGSRTKANVIKATIDGLSQLKTYEEVRTHRYNKAPKATAPKADNE